MSYYEQIYEEVIGNNGIISSRQAAEIGIPPIELVKLCRRGKLTRIGHGVYRIDKYFPQETDPYAAAVAKVGDGAYVIGESVLAYYRLCPTHEALMHIGSSRRVRRRLPPSICLEKRPSHEPLQSMDGVPAQTIPTAIRTAARTVESSRLREAIQEARERQLIQDSEEKELLEELKA